ncbi:hypothetical protein MRB53_001574 [Persea americana]|uniref:Uncharacterized protein n=1 Tax=Persea americana TaxID=3435 RepID=A0ACC2MS42_PERAE|nr:hypothetical protein MRB53_001574 [Persea americana]
MQAEGEEAASKYVRVYSFNLDAEQGKVTVTGNVDPNTHKKASEKRQTCKAMALIGRESSAQQSSSKPCKLTMEKVPNMGNLKRVEKIKRARNNSSNSNNCYKRLKG